MWNCRDSHRHCPYGAQLVSHDSAAHAGACGCGAAAVLLGLGVAFYWGGWPLGLSLLGSVVLVLLLLGYICCIVAKSFNKLP